MLRLLTFTTLFPNASALNHGVFVENRLRHLVATGHACAEVLAPVPWFPSADARFGTWARYAAVPAREQRHGLQVHHPRYPVIPRFGMSAAPALLYAASARALRRMLHDGCRFDAIDAHYFYPDGVAALWLGRRFGLPVVITARGSDVTQLPDHAVPRWLIRRAAARADAIITVSAGLRRALIALGVAPEKVTVLRNGVDLAAFRPLDPVAARAALGVRRPTLVSVGALIPRKGHHHTIAAMTQLAGWNLLIVGEGSERSRLQALVIELGLGDRVRLLGARPHGELAGLYSAATMSVLASSREGWANVLLESMACGTPVVASPIAGNDEVVADGAAGRIAQAASADGIAQAVRALAADLPTRAATRAYAERFGWEETSAGQLALFGRVLSARAGAKAEP